MGTVTRPVSIVPVVACLAGLLVPMASFVAPAAAADRGPLLGSPNFKPTPERPVGWRGDWTGRFPGATPPTEWGRRVKGITTDIRYRADKPSGEPGRDSRPLEYFTIKEWLVAGPYPVENPAAAMDKDFLGGEAKAEPARGAKAGTATWKPLRVFITAEPDWLICLDAETGKELWRKAHKVADFPAASDAKRPVRPSEYGDATPTPVSDGRRIWVFFGTGIVACHDLDGQCRWANWYDMRRVTTYGRTASPLLVGDRLLVHFGPLVCLDAATGRVLWQADGAKAAYGTPAPARIGDVDVVVTPKGHVVRVADGKILAADLGHCLYASPVVQGRVVYFIDREMLAVQLPQTAGDKAECRELWFEELSGEFFASPLVYDGRIYTVDRAANYFVIDAATGKTLLEKTLEMPPAGRSEAPNVYPSICLAGKRLLICNDAGDATLLEPGDQGSVVARNSLPGGSGGTPTLSGQRMFLRCGKVLYGLGPALLRP